MSGKELAALAAGRGCQVFVLDDEQYELGPVHEGRGRERGRKFQDVLAASSGGEPYPIFSIPAEASA